MNVSAPFINRPVATTLLTVAILLSGVVGLLWLPISLLPSLDVPAISVQAQLPGADANTVATSLAGPLERHLGQIADVVEMTSTSRLGQTQINLLFGTSRDGNGAARDVEAAINGTASSGSNGVNDTQRNAAQNALTVTGSNSASAGAGVTTSRETMVPLSAVASVSQGRGALDVNHQNQDVAATISFNLAPGQSLAAAGAAIDQVATAMRMPTHVKRGFAGSALASLQSGSSELILIAASLATIYIVLGILYESFVHPLTILSTLPSAGLGGILALWLLGMAFSAIAAIGLLLLVGIVKKNAILMVDFALTVERQENASTREAIFEACMTRFRPIMMTTLAALFGALPLALAFGSGSEYQRPLGVTIVGGLVVSQILTLYTTPAVYLLLDRLRPRTGAAPVASPAG